MSHTKFFTIVLSALAMSATAIAYDIVPGSNGFNVVECADGTQIGCATSNGPFDCPTTAGSVPAFTAFCAPHGGVVGVVPSGSASSDEGGSDTSEGSSSPPPRQTGRR